MPEDPHKIVARDIWEIDIEQNEIGLFSIR
jgi:hypothetical protein